MDLSGLDTFHTCWMKYMFAGCDNLMRIDGLENINTEGVYDMLGMFYGCENLLSLNLSGFNTGKLLKMGWMFDGCKNLSYLNLKNFDMKWIDGTELYVQWML